MNQSLDDFIQNTFSSRRRDRGRSRSRGPRRSGASDRQNNPTLIRRRQSFGGPISDARYLIIQKKRQKLTDARDQLAQLARHSDLRSKLDRLRGGSRKDMMRPQSYLGITKQTALNGELSLKTNKQSQSRYAHFTPKDHLAVRGPLLRIVKNDIQDVFVSGGTRQKSAPVIRRTVWNDPFVPPDVGVAGSYGSHQSVHRTIRNDSFVPRGMAVFLSDDLAHPSVKRSLNDLGSQSYQVLMPQQSRYGWDSHTMSRRRGDELIVEEASSMTSRLLSQRDEWARRNPAKRRQDAAVIPSVEVVESDDDDMGMVGPSRVSSELKARLDSSSSYSGRPASLSNTPKPLPQHAVPKPGHRIVVSNLHPTVIHEDIRELFEDVGTLIDSRVVRPGTAEVVYQNLEDAVKAVDLYHNRHLDGQPMKCLLVNNTTSKTASSLRTDTTAQFKLPMGTKSSIVPDVLTIHKALFNKS